MARRPKRRGEAGPRDRGELARRRPEAGEPAVLGAERRSEEPRVVGPEGDRDASAKEREDGAPRERKGSRRVVRGEADVEGDPGPGEAADERRVGRGGDTVGDPPGLQPAERVGDRVGASRLPGVDDGREAEAGKPPVDGGEVARGERELVAPEAEADRARPRAPLVRVEDAVGRVGPEVPDGVEEDADPPAPGPLVRGKDGLDGVTDGAPVESEPVDDARGDVDLGVRDPLPREARGQVAREEREVGRPAQQTADVPVEAEEAGKAVEGAPGADGGGVGKERRAGPPGEPDEGRGAHGPLEVEVEVGERSGRDGGHAGRSYGTGAGAVSSRVASERLWLRAAAFGLDLICLAGGPLLLATVTVFLVVLVAPEPPAGLPWVYRAAQLVFVVLFLFRDARGASPGKLLLGLSVARPDARPLRPVDSVLRNLPLLVPGLNLYEAAAVVRRPDARRLGDRLAGTSVGES